MKQKQLAKGIDQLMDEGVAQLFINQFNGRKIIGTVGQLQFEVIQYRLENEYNAKCRWEPISLYKACWVESDDPEELEAFKKRKYQYMAKDREGRDVFLADSNYVLQMAQMDFKHIKFHLPVSLICCWRWSKSLRDGHTSFLFSRNILFTLFLWLYKFVL